MSYSLIFSQVRGNFPTLKEDSSSLQPLVTFKIGSQKVQTKAVKNLVDDAAIWNESYAMHDIQEKGHGILEVSVQDHKTLLPDTTLGSGTVNMVIWTSDELKGLSNLSVPLISKKGRGIGQLHFHVKHSGYNIEEAKRSVQAVPINQLAGKTDESGGRVDGIGAGTNYETAKEAATKAAAQKRDVTVDRADGVAAGKPVEYGGSEKNAAMQYESGLDTAYNGERGPRDENQIVNGGKPRSTATSQTGVKGVDVQPGEIIDRKYYTGVEDRPQEQALIERFREHHPYVRHYETTVHHTGRERLARSKIETLETKEQVEDSRNLIHENPHDAIARAVPTNASSQAIGGDGWVQGEKGPICSSQKFEITGDVEVDKKRVTNLREHRDWEKEFEIVTKFVEEVPQQDKAHVEQLSRDRVLRAEKEKVACEGAQGVQTPA